MRGATVRRVLTAATCLAFVVVFSACSGSGSTGAPGDNGPASASATATASRDSAATVEIPYRGDTSATLPGDWATAACPVGKAPNLISVSCEGNRITFSATGYSPDQATQSVRIAAVAGGAARTFTYRVSLAAPSITGPADLTLPVLVAKGTPVTVPYSELPASCTACGGKAPTYVAGKANPARAGTVAFSGAGLVYYPASGFVGNATLTFHVRDEYGGLSQASSIAVTVTASTSHLGTIAPTLVRIGPDQSAEGNTLVGDIAEEGLEATVSSCGRPGHGRVVCQPDGSFVYTPAPGFTGVDQFAYYVVASATGEQAIGSVAIGVDADPAGVAVTTGKAETAPVTAPSDRAETPDGALTTPYEATKDIRARLARV